jgi:hypothetical protein
MLLEPLQILLHLPLYECFECIKKVFDWFHFIFEHKHSKLYLLVTLSMLDESRYKIAIKSKKKNYCTLNVIKKNSYSLFYINFQLLNCFNLFFCLLVWFASRFEVYFLQWRTCVKYVISKFPQINFLLFIIITTQEYNNIHIPKNKEANKF